MEKRSGCESSQTLEHAFVARVRAREGKESELKELMTGAVELANTGEGTRVWFSVTTSPDTSWLFDAFATAEARQEHADGEIVKALNANADLLTEDPEIPLVSELP
ncbi:MAG: antibiotic biosynthesis monooxygenase [Actinobacteria bacterium]|nr:antibiotic biosynthesis monooxygenase [Actinomycetota bacterium]